LAPSHATTARSALVKPSLVRGGVAEIELAQVAVQMGLAAVLVDALHPALEHGEVVFDGVRMHVAAHTYSSAEWVTD
jgi:uncharacterized protein related to proFAR isomerase